MNMMGKNQSRLAAGIYQFEKIFGLENKGRFYSQTGIEQ